MWEVIGWLAASLVAVEVILNLGYRVRRGRFYRGNKYFYCFDSEIGFRTRDNLQVTISKRTNSPRGTGRVVYQCGRFGFRWYEGSSDKRPILFLGDSFTESVQFANEDTFCGHLSHLLKGIMPIVNAGLGGSRMIHSYGLLRVYGPKVNPGIVLVQVSHNDFYDAALGLTDNNDRFQHRLMGVVACSRMEEIAKYSALGNLIWRLTRGNKRTRHSLERKLEILRGNLASKIWILSMGSICLQMMMAKGSWRIVFYIPPSPFSPMATEEEKERAVVDIGMGSSAFYDLFVEYYRKVHYFGRALKGLGLDVWDMNEKMQSLSAMERMALFIDRSHLSFEGHRWFAGELARELRATFEGNRS